MFEFNFYGWAFFIGSFQITFGIWFVNKTNAPSYIKFTFEIYGKKYGIQNLVTNTTNVIATYMQILCVTFAILTKFTY
jgi:hypothetical protein